MNYFDIPPKGFQKEQEILFNALNVYKVKSIEKQGNFHEIHLEYGAIFDLIKKDKN